MMKDRGAINEAVINDYQTFLREAYRPPSKGGNTKAWHSHVLTIDGERYSFLALGTKKWVFKGDTVSFEWELANGKFRNIIRESICVKDRNGKEVVRGNRNFNKRWRTAETRMPVSRREMRD